MTEKISQFLEFKSEFIRKEPLIGSFIEGRIKDANLPEEIKNNPEILKECNERKNLISGLESIYSKIPILTDIEDALKIGIVKEKDISDLYFSIEKLIENDPINNRILLYFPFELIPDKTKTDINEIVNFSNFYKTEWRKLLENIDLRADYIDGDIPEAEIRKGDLPRVSKAAHMIPILLDKNILTIDDVFNLLENETNGVVVDSIADTLRILAEKKYINESNLSQLENSKNINIRNTASLIKYDISNSFKTRETPTIGQEEIFSLMRNELEESSKYDSKLEISEKRAKWINSVNREDIINKYASRIFEIIKDNKSDWKNILKETGLNDEGTCVIIKVLEKMALSNDDREATIKFLSKFKENKSITVSNFLKKTINRLNSVNLLDKKYISQDKNYEEEIKNITEKILSEFRKSELLASGLYPIIIPYGSQVKNYNQGNSDMDIAVFVKENISFSAHLKIKEELESIFKKTNMEGSAMEFWLNEENGKLWIRDFENPDNSLGDSTITSPLTSPWYGDKKEMDHMQKIIFSQYFYLSNKKLFGHDYRKLWFRDIEHNFLQYRLMHKGYKNSNLEQGGIDSKYKDEIDGESSFYDSGYRRLATKLFLEKVFIPQLKK